MSAGARRRELLEEKKQLEAEIRELEAGLQAEAEVRVEETRRLRQLQKEVAVRRCSKRERKKKAERIAVHTGEKRMRLARMGEFLRELRTLSPSSPPCDVPQNEVLARLAEVIDMTAIRVQEALERGSVECERTELAPHLLDAAALSASPTCEGGCMSTVQLAEMKAAVLQAAQLELENAERQVAEVREGKRRLGGDEDEDREVEDSLLDVTVDALIEEMQERHISRFVEEEEARMQASDAEATAAVLEAQLDASATSDHIREMQRAEAEAAGTAAALQLLSDTARRLELDLSTKEGRWRELQVQKGKIANFEQEERAKRSLVHLLLTANAKNRASFGNHERRLREVLQSRILPLQMRLPGAERATEDMVERLVSALLAMDGDLLVRMGASDTADAREMAMPSVSLRLRQGRDERLARVLSALGLPYGLASDRILDAVCEMKESRVPEERLEGMEASVATLRQEAGGSIYAFSQKAVDELKAAAEARVAHYDGVLLPQMRAVAQNLRVYTSECKAAEQLLDDWWKQPARHAAPFVKVADRSFDEYLQRWKALEHSLLIHTQARK